MYSYWNGQLLLSTTVLLKVFIRGQMLVLKFNKSDVYLNGLWIWNNVNWLFTKNVKRKKLFLIIKSKVWNVSTWNFRSTFTISRLILFFFLVIYIYIIIYLFYFAFFVTFTQLLTNGWDWDAEEERVWVLDSSRYLHKSIFFQHSSQMMSL